MPVKHASAKRGLSPWGFALATGINGSPEMSAHDIRFKRDRRIRVNLEEKATQWLWLAGDREIVPGSLKS
jgi:hypothetical protein